MNFHKSFIKIFAITFGLLAATGVLAWTGPAAAPPASNASAPLNTSATGQVKVGGLQLNTGGAATGLIVSGNVGIGTTNPSAKLDVQGTLRIGHGAVAGYQFTETSDDTSMSLGYWNTATNNYTPNILTVGYTGNVGIGTASPGSPLSIATSNSRPTSITYTGTDMQFNTFVNSSVACGSGGQWAVGLTGSSPTSIPIAPGSFVIHEDCFGPRFVIASNGNVGIGGMNNPGAPLTVSASTDHVLNVRGDPVAFGLPSTVLGPILQGVNTAQSLFEPMTLTGSSLYLITYGGNVGINTVVPAATLDVSGSIRSSGNINAGNALFANNGDIYMPYSGQYLSNVLGWNGSSYPRQTAVIFGGGFQLTSYGGCYIANAYTGGCSCPAYAPNARYTYYMDTNSSYGGGRGYLCGS